MTDSVSDPEGGFELVPVTTYVHPSRVAQFQRLAAGFAEPLAGGPADRSVPLVGVEWPTNANDQGDAWALPAWEGPDDAEKARWVAAHSSDWGVAVLTALAESNEALPTTHLATVFPAPHGQQSVPPVLRGISNRARKVTRRPPWQIQRPDDATCDWLVMTAETKAAFRPALRLE